MSPKRRRRSFEVRQAAARMVIAANKANGEIPDPRIVAIAEGIEQHLTTDPAWPVDRDKIAHDVRDRWTAATRTDEITVHADGTAFLEHLDRLETGQAEPPLPAGWSVTGGGDRVYVRVVPIDVRTTTTPDGTTFTWLNPDEAKALGRTLWSEAWKARPTVPGQEGDEK